MQFNSYIFILVFLPVQVIGYFLAGRLGKTAGKLVLIAGSAVFYLYAGLDVALIFGISVLFNLLASAMIRRAEKGKKPLLAAAVAVNIALLFYYKYANFFLANLGLVMGRDFTMRNVVLPLGISFFTFQQLSWLINVRRGELDDAGVLDYLAYILYFPKLIMGPITEPGELIAQLNDDSLRRVNWDNIARGLKLLSFGLFKKLLLADTFAAAVSWGFGSAEAATSMDLFLVMLFYTFEIYFDFSGYSDMAVGVSLMLNIRLPMNFDSPYKALSIRDFWKRWHMTLTGFLTKYLYIPLGGSKKGKLRTYLNTMIVFLVSGIWHGANWTFILWGALHGALSIFDRVFDKWQRRLMETVRWFFAFLSVNVLWLLFRADSIAQWRDMLVRMFTFGDMSVSAGLLRCFQLPETGLIMDMLHMGGLNAAVRGLWLLIFTAAAFLLCLIPENNYRNLDKTGWLQMVAAAAAFVWSFLCLSSESVFVYFNF